MMLKKATWLFVLVFVLCLSVRSAEATDNYCQDQESWDEWEALVQKYPGDMDLHALHALRIGLCAKVTRGDLSVEEATDIFERARERILEKKKSEGWVAGELKL
jgi:hypothetical protein